MIRFFLIIKEKFPFIWRWIEWANGFVFQVFYAARFKKAGNDALAVNMLEGFSFRFVGSHDLPLLSRMILSQGEDELHFFEAHKFDVHSLRLMLKNPSFLMMAVFEEKKLVGYFFLRCLINRKCFVGRMVDKSYRGRGIGLVMNEIMYNTAWNAGFRCFATVSKNNQLVMKAHENNKRVVYLDDLPDDHILIEFVNTPH